MRVLVCGGRDFDNWALMAGVLRICYGDKKGKPRKGDVMITGDACGADWLARAYAKDTNRKYEGYPADWKKYGKAAGPIRNQQMLDEGKPDIVVAFPGGVGTADMVRRARKAGVEVIEVR